MGISAWVVVGLVSGWLAEMAVPSRQPIGIVTTTLVGVIGAIVGGQLWDAMSPHGTTGIKLDTNFIALVGAVVCLTIWKSAMSRPTA